MASCVSDQNAVCEFRPWSEEGEVYVVLEKFPSLRKRLETGLHCLTSQERADLKRLASKRESELRAAGRHYLTPLHHKVSLVAGGNLVQLAVDATVNASNHWLTPGKGVNGAVHSGAGSCLLEECLSLGGCAVGEAKITGAYNLPAKHIIHTVGPDASNPSRDQLLRSCYLSVLKLCQNHGLRTVAFPCISTGAYRYPTVEAADIAIATVREWLLEGQNAESIDRIVFVTRRLCDEEAYAILMLTYFPLI